MQSALFSLKLVVTVLLLLLDSCSCMDAVKLKRSPLEVGFVTFGDEGFFLRHQNFKMKGSNKTITVTNSENLDGKGANVPPEAMADTYSRISSHTHRWVPGHVVHHAYIPAHLDHLYVPALFLAKTEKILAHPTPYMKTIYGGFGVGAGSGGPGVGHGFRVVLSYNTHQGLL